MSLKISNKSPEKAEMTTEGAFTTFSYINNIPYGGDSTLTVELLDEEGSITNLQVLPTCGCTVSSVEKEGNTYTATIVYDTTRRGRFNKQLQVPYKSKGSSKKIIFNIKGTVI